MPGDNIGIAQIINGISKYSRIFKMQVYAVLLLAIGNYDTGSIIEI